MKVSLMQNEPARTFVVVLDPGDEVMESITGFARQNNVMSAHITAIGAFSHATLAWFNPDIKDYDYIPVNEQVEVASLVGNIATHEGEPRLHAHASVARRDGSGIGGHIIEAFVRPTLEIVATEFVGQLERKQDGRSALPMLSL